MSARLFVYLDTRPSLDDMQQTLHMLGFNYKHTLAADESWDYPMHVFGCDDLRVVYHAGDPQQGEAILDSMTIGSFNGAEVRLQLVLSAVTRRYGGAVYDPQAALLSEVGG
jgi:hypothetical protein